MIWNIFLSLFPGNYYTTRDLTMKDLNACYDIVKANWDEEIAQQARDEMDEMFSLQRWPPHYFVAVDHNNKVVGFAGYRPSWIMSRAYELVWVNIHPDHQNKGLGKMLTDKRMQSIEKLEGSLVMLMTQKPLFFEPFGFEVIKDIDDWVLMMKQLAPIKLSNRNS